MGSSLQLLNHTRWEVFCQNSKMKFLVLLLSATLATVAYGAANPGGHHFGHAYHDGPHCHDQKDHQCHKTPKQQEHEECFVDYDIIVDVTYIEECELLSSHIVQKSMNRSTTTHALLKESLVLLMLIMKTMLVITTSVQPILETMDTPVVLTVKTRRRSSATSTPRKTLARSPSRLARRLWTPSLLKSVKRESTLFVRKLMREVTTALVLLIIIQRLLLPLITQDIMRLMEVIITRIYFRFYNCLLK